MSKYWKDFRDPVLPRFQGGFIWDFCDQGLLLEKSASYNYVHGTNGRPAYGYGGDFDDLPNTKQFCCNGIASPERRLYPSALEAAFLQAPLELALFYTASGPAPTSSSGDYTSRQAEELPVLLITSRRFHSSLEDITLSVSLHYYHPLLLLAEGAVSFPSFSIPCGAIMPQCYQNVPLSGLIAAALKEKPVLFKEGSQGNGSREMAAFLQSHYSATESGGRPAESWLEVSARGTDGTEVLHTSISSKKLTKMVSQSLQGLLETLKQRCLMASSAPISSSSSEYTSLSAKVSTNCKTIYCAFHNERPHTK